MGQSRIFFNSNKFIQLYLWLKNVFPLVVRDIFKLTMPYVGLRKSVLYKILGQSKHLRNYLKSELNDNSKKCLNDWENKPCMGDFSKTKIEKCIGESKTKKTGKIIHSKILMWAVLNLCARLHLTMYTQKIPQLFRDRIQMVVLVYTKLCLCKQKT